MSPTSGPASHRAAVFPGATSSRYAQDRPARLTAPAAAVVLAAALLLGGGTMLGLPGDAIVIATGLLLAVLLVTAWPAPALRPYRLELSLLTAVLAAQQAAVGIAPHWAPPSLDSAGTWRAWLALPAARRRRCSAAARALIAEQSPHPPALGSRTVPFSALRCRSTVPPARC